jgi:hypothetical protein
MNTKFISRFTQPKTTRLIVVMLGLSLLISACTGTTGNSTSPTATTAMGVLPPVEQSTPISTEVPPVSSNTAGPVDVCAMVSTADVATVLGSDPIATQPGMDTDNETGVTINFCTYLGQGTAVILSTTDPASAEIAKTYLQNELAQQQNNDATSVITEETGVGDQLFWNVATNAASYTVRIGSHVFSIALGGTIGDPASHKAALLELAKKIASAY